MEGTTGVDFGFLGGDRPCILPLRDVYRCITGLLYDGKGKTNVGQQPEGKTTKYPKSKPSDKQFPVPRFAIERHNH